MCKQLMKNSDVSFNKPVPFGTADVRTRALALRENSSELLKEFQSARKTGNSRPETHELVSLWRVYT